MPSKPVNKPTDTALLESIQKEMRLMTEAQLALRAEISDVKLRLIILDPMRSDLVTLKGALMELTRDLKALKSELESKVGA